MLVLIVDSVGGRRHSATVETPLGRGRWGSGRKISLWVGRDVLLLRGPGLTASGTAKQTEY